MLINTFVFYQKSTNRYRCNAIAENLGSFLLQGGFVLFFSLIALRLGAGELELVEPARFFGNFGLRITLGAGMPVFLSDDLPQNENRIRCRFYCNMDHLNIEEGHGFDLWVGQNVLLESQLVLSVERVSGSNRFFFLVMQDDGSVVELPSDGSIDVPMGWQSIEFEWVTGDGNGILKAWQGEDMVINKENLWNSMSRINAAEWGVTTVPSPATTGFLDLDCYETRRAGEIGPICFEITDLRRSFKAWPQTSSVLRLVMETNYECP